MHTRSNQCTYRSCGRSWGSSQNESEDRGLVTNPLSSRTLTPMRFASCDGFGQGKYRRQDGRTLATPTVEPAAVPLARHVRLNIFPRKQVYVRAMGPMTLPVLASVGGL